MRAKLQLRGRTALEDGLMDHLLLKSSFILFSFFLAKVTESLSIVYYASETTKSPKLGMQVRVTESHARVGSTYKRKRIILVPWSPNWNPNPK